MAWPMGRRRTEHAERGIGTTEQPDARQDEGTHQQHAGDGAEYTHEPTSLSRWVGKDLARLLPVWVGRSLPVVRLSHEASVGE